MTHSYPAFSDLETLCRGIGLLGFCLYVCAFFGLSVGRLDSREPMYFFFVLTASTCVLISLWADFNLSAALIQGFYIVMSLGAILFRFRRPAALPQTIPVPANVSADPEISTSAKMPLRAS